MTKRTDQHMSIYLDVAHGENVFVTTCLCDSLCHYSKTNATVKRTYLLPLYAMNIIDDYITDSSIGSLFHYVYDGVVRLI